MNLNKCASIKFDEARKIFLSMKSNQYSLITDIYTSSSYFYYSSYNICLNYALSKTANVQSVRHYIVANLGYLWMSANSPNESPLFKVLTASISV